MWGLSGVLEDSRVRVCRRSGNEKKGWRLGPWGEQGNLCARNASLTDLRLIPPTTLSCLSLYGPSFPITVPWWILIWGWEGANRPIWSSLWHVVPKTVLEAPVLCTHGLPFWSCIKVRGHLLGARSAPWARWRHVLCGPIPASPSLHLLCLFEQPVGHNWCLTFLQGAWPFAFSPVLLWKIPAPPAVQVLL